MWRFILTKVPGSSPGNDNCNFMESFQLTPGNDTMKMDQIRPSATIQS